MGIRHLTTFLCPYAVSEPLQNSSVVIDGPGFAYHIYYASLGNRKLPSNPLEAAPSYRDLANIARTWLDELRKSGVEMWLPI